MMLQVFLILSSCAMALALVPSSIDAVHQNRVSIRPVNPVRSVLPVGALSPRSSPVRQSSALKVMSASSRDSTIKKVINNVNEGKVGERGELLVISQGLVILCVLAGGIPFVGPTINFFAGPTTLVIGLVMIAASIAELDEVLSPWVVPSTNHSLKTSGLFSYCRNPIYGGLLLACFGFGITTNSASRLILTALLYVVLSTKVAAEETYLEDKYNSEWERYKQAVPGKFLPSIATLATGAKESRAKKGSTE